MIAAGQDLDWIDAQGATLVRRGARLDWAGGGQDQNPDQLELNWASAGGGQAYTVGACPWLWTSPTSWGQGCPWNVGS